MMRRLGHSYAQAARAVGCLALVVLLLSGCSLFTPSGPPWIEMHPRSHPAKRSGVMFYQSAYDAVTKQVVLYGESLYGVRLGTVNNPNFTQTSLWNGRDWTDLHPAVQPPHQPGVAMAYDAATKSIVLVAPEATFLNTSQADVLMARAKARQSSHAYQAFIRHLFGITETWIWNGATWTELHPSASPPPPPAWIPGQYMAYDAATRSVVFLVPVAHGGLETWTWNGITWTQQHPSRSPQSRFDFAMAYDPQVREVLVFGGFQSLSAPVLGDTWAWNGKNWIRLHPPVSPPARYGASMAYDPQVRELVLFGGTDQISDSSSSLQVFGDTWAWNARTWTELHPSTSPPPLMRATIAYDAATKSIVLFGGSGSSGHNHYDTWTLKLGMTPSRHRASEPVKAHARAATTHR